MTIQKTELCLFLCIIEGGNMMFTVHIILKETYLKHHVYKWNFIDAYSQGIAAFFAVAMLKVIQYTVKMKVNHNF